MDSRASSGLVTEMAAGARPERSRSSGARNGMGRASSRPRPTSVARIRRRSRWRSVRRPVWGELGTVWGSLA